MQHFTSKTFLSFGLMCLFVFFFSCKKSTTTSSTVKEISLTGTSFSPVSVTVSKGTTVKWTNRENMTHTVTSDDALFDSGDMTLSQVYSRVFDSIGTFNYHCIYHSGMNGIVIVN